MLLQNRQWQLGPWSIDEGRQIVSIAGDVLPIRQKLLAVLVCLIEHYPDVAETERLIELVWGPYANIDRAGVNHAIWGIRQVLQQDSGTDVIETIPKRGYRLLLEPQEIASISKTRAAPMAVLIQAS